MVRAEPEEPPLAEAIPIVPAPIGGQATDNDNVINTDLVASTVSYSFEEPASCDNNGITAVLSTSSASAEVPSSTIDALHVTPATDNVPAFTEHQPELYAYGLSDAHYEDYWSKKYRRRRRRRRRCVPFAIMSVA